MRAITSIQEIMRDTKKKLKSQNNEIIGGPLTQSIDRPKLTGVATGQIQ